MKESQIEVGSVLVLDGTSVEVTEKLGNGEFVVEDPNYGEVVVRASRLELPGHDVDGDLLAEARDYFAGSEEEFMMG